MFGSEQGLAGGSAKEVVFRRLFGHEHLGHHVRALHVSRMLRSAVGAPQAVLDAGSGDGSLAFHLAARFPRASVLGIELDAPAVSRCREILARLRYPNVQFIQGDLESFRADQSFDLIVCVDVLEHVKDDRLALDNLFHSLRQGGQLVIHVPRRHQELRYYTRRNPFAGMVRDHVRDEYTSEEIRCLLSEAGFVIRETKYTFGPAGSLARELFYWLDAYAPGNPLLRSLAKLMAYPVLLSLARFDTLGERKAAHQGFLIRAARP